MLTPYDLQHGLAEGRRSERAGVLLDAWAKHPEHFPNGRPLPAALPTAPWINKPIYLAAPAEPADQRPSTARRPTEPSTKSEPQRRRRSRHYAEKGAHQTERPTVSFSLTG